MTLFRYVLGGVLLAVAGFIAFGLGLVAFMEDENATRKLVGMAIYGFIFLLSCLLGLAIFPGNVAIAGGVVLLVPAVLNFFTWMIMQIMLLEQDQLSQTPVDSLRYFSDHFTGFAVLLVSLSLGACCVVAGQRHRKRVDAAT